MNKFNIQPFTRHYKALEKDYSLESYEKLMIVIIQRELENPHRFFS